MQIYNLIYFDDIIVFAKTYKEMNRNLSNVFDRLAGTRLALKAKEFNILAESVDYLGHLVYLQIQSRQKCNDIGSSQGMSLSLDLFRFVPNFAS